MKTEFIKLRVSTEQKKAIKEASKDSPSMSNWIIERILPRVFIGMTVDVPDGLHKGIGSQLMKESMEKKRCMASHCKSMETTSKLVHGSTVWLCATHYDKG